MRDQSKRSASLFIYRNIIDKEIGGEKDESSQVVLACFKNRILGPSNPQEFHVLKMKRTPTLERVITTDK